jgi:hypothetical protein
MDVGRLDCFWVWQAHCLRIGGSLPVAEARFETLSRDFGGGRWFGTGNQRWERNSASTKVLENDNHGKHYLIIQFIF